MDETRRLRLDKLWDSTATPLGERGLRSPRPPIQPTDPEIIRRATEVSEMIMAHVFPD